jgi:arylsulfatase A-like enzyme
VTQRQWNILWITLEDCSPRLSCMDDPVAHSPHLDRLAAQGCVYPLAFATAGVCAPSRAAVITGMYATSIGAHHMRTTHTNPWAPELPTPYAAVPPPYVHTISAYLRAAGYYCSNNAKTDYQFPAPCTAWDACGDRAHWRGRAPGQPFFAVFNFTATHESGMWPRGDTETEDAGRTDPARVTLPPYLPDTPRTRAALAQHYDNLATVDAQAGRVLAELEEDGLAADTAVFVWSDHGEGLPRAKRWLYDAGIRVPLIVRWPGHTTPGTRADELVSLIDLGPTALALAGVPLPRHLQGQPFLGPEARPRQYVFAARDRHDEAYDMVRAVRDRRYKYIRNYCQELPYLQWIPYAQRHPAMQELWRLYARGELDGDRWTLFRPRPPEELYDTAADPWELHNLAGDPALRPTLERLRQALDAWRRDTGDRGEEPETEMARRMWPAGQQPTTATPLFIPLGADHAGLEPTAGGRFPAPLLLQLHCSTQGALVEWTDDPPDAVPVRWHLYTAPLRLEGGTVTLRARAARIGWRDSAERSATFVVGDG